MDTLLVGDYVDAVDVAGDFAEVDGQIIGFEGDGFGGVAAVIRVYEPNEIQGEWTVGMRDIVCPLNRYILIKKHIH